MNRKKKFWEGRLVFALVQIPIFGVLCWVGSDRHLLYYLGWVSVLTWISSELPTGGES